MSTTKRVRLRRSVAGAGALAMVAGSSVFLAVGDAAAAQSFQGVASAYGTDGLIINETIPGGIQPEFGGPVAQAELTSLPSGTSFASFPYPGDVVAGVPGLLSSIVIGLPPIPPYPFIVSSGLGQGKQTNNQPGVSMTAQTEETQAAAHAVAGLDGSGAVADSQVVANPSGGVTATATAQVNGVSLGGLGTVGQVNTSASATLNASGARTTESHLEITGLSLPIGELTVPDVSPAPAPIPGFDIPQVPLPFAGLKLTAPKIGFVDGQFTTQLPLLGNQQFAIPAQTALDALKSAGIDAQYSAPIKTTTGIIAATFTLTYVSPAIPQNQVYSGPTTVKLVFGRASASVSGTAATPDTVLPPGGGTTGSPLVPGVPSPSIPGGQGVDPGGSTGGLPVGSGSGGIAPTTGGSPGSGQGPVVAGPDTGQGGAQPQGFTTLLGRRGPLSLNIYLVLVAAGLIGTFSSQTLRLLGVRHR